MLDFPSKVEQSEKTKTQNAALKKQYKIDAFPTLLLLDEKGRPYSKGDLIFEVDAHAAELHGLSKERLKRDEKFAAAKKREGIEKATALLDALTGMSIPTNHLSEFYTEEIAAIAKADPEDTLAFSKKLKDIAGLDSLNNALGEVYSSKDWDAGFKHVDTYVQTFNPTGENLQKALSNKLFFYEYKEEFASAIALIEEIIKIDPDSPTGNNTKLIRGNFKRDFPELYEEKEK